MKNRELVGKMVSMVQTNPVFWEALFRRNILNEKRLSLLHEILLAIEGGRMAQATDKIFQYGAMLGKKDVVARQIFLYLLLLAEEQEKLQRAGN